MSLALAKARQVADLAACRGVESSAVLTRAIQLAIYHIISVLIILNVSVSQAIDRARNPGKLGRRLVRRVVNLWLAPEECLAVEIGLLALGRLITAEEMAGLYREVHGNIR